MYAAGVPSAQKEASLNFLEKVESGQIDAASSAEVLQEILHRYRAINQLQKGLEAYDLFRALSIRWLDVTAHDVDEARYLLESHERLSSRDALHLAVMQRNKIHRIVTFDRGFLGLTDITVFQPDQL